MVQLFTYIFDEHYTSGDVISEYAPGYLTVSKSLLQILRSASFHDMARLHPWTARHLLMRNPIIGSSLNMDVLAVVDRYLSYGDIFELIHSALDIHTVCKLALLDGVSDTPFYLPTTQTYDELKKQPRSSWPEILLKFMAEENSILSFVPNPDSSPDLPLFLRIDPLVLAKAMILEAIESFYNLTNASLFVMEGIITCWRDPALQPLIANLIGLLSEVRPFNWNQETLMFRLLTVPLIMAAFAGEREFASILPRNFFAIQLILHGQSTDESKLILYLMHYYEEEAEELDDDALNYASIRNELVFGFMGFNEDKIWARIAQLRATHGPNITFANDIWLANPARNAF